jgi:hypothetical protein
LRGTLVEENERKLQTKETAKHQGLVDKVKGALNGRLAKRLVGA